VPNPVIHWEIGARDRKKLQEFYTSLFGWSVNDNNPMQYGLMDSAAGGINGGIWQCEPGVPTYATFYVSVDDVQSALDRATALGATTVIAPMPIPNVGTIGMLKDPEGNLIGLIKMLKPAA